jgi:hypothetical protein
VSWLGVNWHGQEGEDIIHRCPFCDKWLWSLKRHLRKHVKHMVRVRCALCRVSGRNHAPCFHPECQCECIDRALGKS